MATYLSPTANIIENPAFERAVVKILEAREDSLTSEEALSALCLTKKVINIDDEKETGKQQEEMSYYEQIQAKRRRTSQTSKYIDCRFLVATTCRVERLFSEAKHILTDVRKHMSPMLFEALLFLRCNLEYWNAALVAEAIQKSKVSEK